MGWRILWSFLEDKLCLYLFEEGGEGGEYRIEDIGEDSSYQKCPAFSLFFLLSSSIITINFFKEEIEFVIICYKKKKKL